MKIEVKVEKSCIEPRIIIITDSMTYEINNIIKKIDNNFLQTISGIKNDKVELIEQSEIIRLYANSGKVFAVTSKGEYIIRFRLYELEERLDKSMFVRISNSEIINLKKTKDFDLSYTGTIRVRLTNNIVTYVSRRYVIRIKKILGM